MTCGHVLDAIRRPEVLQSAALSPLGNQDSRSPPGHHVRGRSRREKVSRSCRLSNGIANPGLLCRWQHANVQLLRTIVTFQRAVVGQVLQEAGYLLGRRDFTGRLAVWGQSPKDPRAAAGHQLKRRLDSPRLPRHEATPRSAPVVVAARHRPTRRQSPHRRPPARHPNAGRPGPLGPVSTPLSRG